MSSDARTSAHLNLEAADAYCRFLTRHHYENFQVTSLFVDAAARRDLARIYAYCRSTDDLGDESPGGSALSRLERWRSEVEGLFAGLPPVHPVLIALARTIERHRMPPGPFLDLIEANVVDQRVTHYRTWPELEGYCALSAAPVGRMVLRVFGITDPRAEHLSDDVCIGLQLANHAQDVTRDAAIGRRYLVETDLADGCVFAVRAMVDRARKLLASGRDLEAMVPLGLRLQLSLYRLGGLAICDAIEEQGYQTEQVRPSISMPAKVRILMRAALQALALPRRVAESSSGDPTASDRTR